MKIGDIEIQNFLTIKSAKINLSERGLVLIQGDNQDDTSADSNGAGKSSIVDAVSWCIYGFTARGVTGDAVVNRTAKKDCGVGVNIRDEDIGYYIRRNRKANGLHVTFHNYTTGVDGVLTKGTEKETQEVINRIMGCSLDVFLAAVYAGQEAMPDLPGMTDKQLKLLIEEAAGIEVLARAYQIARQGATNAENVLTEERRRSDSAMSMVKTATDELAANQLRVVDFEDKRTKDIDAAKALARDHVTAIKDAQELLDKAGEPALKEALKKIGEQLAAVSSVQLASKRLAGLAAADRVSLATWMSKVDTGKRMRDLAIKNLADVDKQVGVPCGTCGKPYAEHDLGEVKKHAQTAVGKLTADLVQLAQMAKQFADNVALSAAESKNYDAANIIDTSAVMTEQASINKALGGITTLRNVMQTRTRDMQASLALAEKLAKDANPYGTMIVESKAKVDKWEAEKAKVDAKVEELKLVFAVAEQAVQVFGPAGVRAHILDTVTPFLNQKTSEYLGALSDGAITAVWSTLTRTAKGETREKFNIEVTHAKGGDSFAGLSGGEKRKVRLATAMALQDMVATRATKPIELFIADEVDHALDHSGLERLMVVLEKKARERGTVLVISHNSLSDWIDNVITVRKKDGFSEVEGATGVV